MMGLAPYGNTKSESYRHFYKLITSEVLNIGDDGSVALNPHYFAFTTSNEMFHQQRWERLFGISRRQPESELSQLQADLALATQKALEEGLRRLGATAQRLTQSRNLAMAGGVALNCVANSALKTTGLFDNIWIQPASGDAGSALGAALAYVHLSEGQERAQPEGPLGDRMAGALLGPEFGPDEIELELQTQRFSYQTFEKFDELCKTTANLLHQNKVVGWFQGRMEFGPRALGSRSILANAKDPAMQAHLNQKIKGRETFRPFAPIVLADDVQDYFEWQGPSPYMLFTAKIKEGRRIETPADFDSRSLRQKLLFQRSDLPSITHIDYSARLQTIHSSLHPQLFQLLQAYKTLSGCSVLINTSFNVREEPIVCSPRDALRCFQNTGMDALVMGNFLLHK
jgi:carbamoyltransferase